MNDAGNCLGQGNRANATIGRALQLVIRNVGGGRPGDVDRATLGQPGKITCCFAEREADSPWESLATERAGLGPDRSAVTLFAGGGVQGVADQRSRTPESLARTFAAVLRGVFHPKLVMIADAMLVVSPEHARVFREAGWSKARLREKNCSRRGRRSQQKSGADRNSRPRGVRCQANLRERSLEAGSTSRCLATRERRGHGRKLTVL